jgi:ferrous iron transport protein B
MSQRISRDIAARELTVAICGNPNCGKTTVFNALTGLRQKVGNYPGVTVEKTTGMFTVSGRETIRFNLVDTPGSYSLSAFSPDEYIATRVLCGDIEGEVRPDLILCVIDATNLDRGLYLLFQVIQVGRPVMVALNMMDLAERHGVRIDVQKLAEKLPGIPIVPVVASRREGIDRLKSALADMAREPSAPRLAAYDDSVVQIVRALAGEAVNGDRTDAQYLRLLFDRGGPAEIAYLRMEGSEKQSQLETYRQEITRQYGALSVGETQPLTQLASAIAQSATGELAAPSVSKSERIDRFLMHSLLGPVFLIAVMVFMFQSVFSWAEPAMHMIDSAFGALAGYVEGGMVQGPLRSLLVDGVIGGVGSVLIFLPQIIILFFFIALLEDSGYMPRAAFLVDRLFGWCGLSGKSFVPMLSSFACAVPGIMATRTIESRKLRIMTILVAPLMSCSARLPVYTIMIAAFIPQRSYLGLFNSRGLVLTGLYLLGMVTAVIVSFLLNRLLYHQERATFMMDMPSYTLPTLRSILIRITNRAKSFVTRAGTVILAITIVIWALSYYPRSAATKAEFDSRIAQVEARFSAERASIEEQLALSGTALAVAYQDSLAWLDAAERTELDRIAHERAGAYLRDSYFGRLGRLVGPAFEPLGWDWKITMATLASFPAREVIIATLGTIYNLGAEEDEISSSLADKMRQARWESGPRTGQSVFSPAVALSIMVFFALCAQCGATLVTIRHETARWRYSLAAFTYMTALAYVAALATYQLFSGMGM